MSEQLEFEFVIDDSDAKKKYDALEKQAADAAKKISEKFAKDDALGEKKAEKLNKELKKATPEAESLGASLVKSAAAWAAALVTVDAAIKLIKLPFFGEQLLAIDAQFNRIAQDAGLSGGKMKDAFEDASRGLVDVDDILRSATSAIINLGDEAAKLPQVLDLSRRIAQTLGGDIQERFEGIVRAVETGNARLLKQNGIILDIDRVLKNYAASLGLAVSELTQANRQQAILNAALEEGAKKFKDGEGSIKPLTDATTRLKIALGDVVEGFAKLAAVNIQQSGITGFIERLADFTNKSANISPLQQQARDAADLRAQIIRLENKLVGYDTQLKELGTSADLAIGATLKGKIIDTERSLESLRQKFAATKATVSENIAPGAGDQSTGGQTPEGVSARETRLTEAQLAAIRARNTQILNLQLQANEAELGLQANKNLQLGTIDEQRLAEQELFGQRLLLLGQQRSAALAQVDSQFSSAQGFTAAQRGAARLAVEQEFNSKIEQAGLDHTAKMKTLAVVRADAIKQILGSGLSSAFQEVGKNLQAGKGLFDDFGANIVGIIGDMIISIGSALIVQGLAIEAFITSINSLLPGSGLAAAAAGVGLVLFGSALKASVGKGGSSAPTANAGGGGFTGGTDTLTPTAPEDIQAAEPKTEISVNVNGNILGTSDRSLGLAISEILSDQFSSQGLVLKG